MEYGICNLGMIPLRAEPRHQSEMVSQLLFGETFELLERVDNWVRVVTTFDGYHGWISDLQFAALDGYQLVTGKPSVITNDIITEAVKLSDQSKIYIPFGSSLPFFEDGKCTIGNEEYHIELQNHPNNLVNIARAFLNAPYVWGGRTHAGIDCSGYVQALMRTQGVNLQRDAWQQAGQGNVVDFLQAAQAGDLAFFDNAEGRIIHVGMMLGNDRIIHASGKVKIDRIDNQGIYSDELKKYTHTLRIVKRFL
ncbi:C40 family peptidase [Mucilaginibacter sp. HMF5004]|uniref:C40 family peptidase n=1 Tax=Mucilaginibacter rivuli TaxID=2857527 RepID=UPI001C5F5DFC|nr:C40 family peptidase [Mucilaginibacter rivuli]MBW4889691.1 C40 family peptidase [Mucilaginibacter rivuli]